MALFLACVYLPLLAIGYASGQSIVASTSSPNVKIGSQLNFTLDSFEVGMGNTLTAITGGYLDTGSCDLRALAYWNDTASSLMVYPRLATESPSYAGRIAITSARTITINSVAIGDQGKRLVFRMFYSNPQLMTKTSNHSTIVVTDFTGVMLNDTATVDTIEGQPGRSISCMSSGIPTPSVYWSKEGVQHLPSYAHISHPPAAPKQNISILSFGTLNRRFRGRYVCKANNFAHNGTQGFFLSVKSGPENVTFKYSNCLNSQPASLCWTSPDDTVDSTPEMYTAKIDTVGQKDLPVSTLCLNRSMYANVTSEKFMVYIQASNQYGSSGFKGFHFDTTCGGEHILPKLSLIAISILAFVAMHQ